MLLFRRDISLYSVPPPPTSSTFAPVDLTAPKVAAGKNIIGLLLSLLCFRMFPRLLDPLLHVQHNQRDMHQI